MTDLEQKLLDEMKQGVYDVIDGKIESWSCSLMHPNFVDKIITERYPEIEQEDYDTNGWDYDYWTYYTINGKRYCLSGSGYYGGHTFALEK